MSENPHTTGQFDPTQQATAPEISRQQVINANGAEIMTAAGNEVARLHKLLPTMQHGGIEWSHLREQIHIAGQTRSKAQQYNNSPHLGFKTFNSFLSAQMEGLDVTDEDDYAEYEKLQKVESWFDKQVSFSDGGVIGDVLRAKGESEVTTQSQPSSENIPVVNKQVETAQQRRAVENARHSVEQAQSIELFSSVVKIGKNHTQLHTDVNGGFKDIGDDKPRATRLTNKPGGFQETYKRDYQPASWRQELNETVIFTNVVEQDKRQVTAQHKIKGRFGRTVTTDYTTSENVPGSDHPKTMPNPLTGQSEPVVIFRYDFNLRSGNAGLASSTGELPRYQEYRGYRNGQTISVGLELPKSIADQLQQQVRQDPASVRTLVEQLFLQNNDGQLSEEDWRQGHKTMRHPVRPPYEDLPDDWDIVLAIGNEGDRVTDYQIQRLAV